MPIKLPKLPILTSDELREQFVAQHEKVVAGVRKAIEDLCAHHRQAYADYLYGRRLSHIQSFLDKRKSNELFCEGVAKQMREEDRIIASLSGGRHHRSYKYLQDLKDSAEESIRWIRQYTNHPTGKEDMEKADGVSYFEYQKALDRYAEWMRNENRPDFVVVWLDEGKDKIKAEVEEVVEQAVQSFVRKTIHKVVDILVAKGKYVCELQKGGFDSGMFEGDILITFPDGTGFRTHVILKTNYSVNGKPYSQYPLTFHEVVTESGGKPAAMLSEDEICKAMGVSKWEAPKKQKKPWDTVKLGDIVCANYKFPVLVLGIRGNVATIYHPNLGEEKIQGSEIKAILARTRGESFLAPYYVRVDPFDGAVFKVNPPAGMVYNRMDSENKLSNALRKACFEEIVKKLTDGMVEKIQGIKS